MEERPLVNVFARLPGRALRCVGLGFAISCSSGMALATETFKEPQPFETPQPFEAQYRLEVRGWPGATITHRLSNEGNHWLSDMRFSITVARGQEFSRFSLNGNDTNALLFSSSYSVLGVGDSYQLNEGEIPTLDRQAALFDLSRRAGHENCTQSTPCAIEFVDQKGRDEHFQYYVTAPGSIEVPAGEFDPDWPGLILSAVYRKEGRRETQLTLTNFNPNGGATP